MTVTAEDLLVDIFLLGLFGRVSSDCHSHVRLYSIFSRFRRFSTKRVLMCVGDP